MCLCATVNIRDPATLKNDSKKSETLWNIYRKQERLFESFKPYG